MDVVALAGGVGAGKFLRGLVRVVDPTRLTVIVNTGDDIRIHGLHVSPDVDSVLYALAGLHDDARGWGRESETFRTTEQLRDRFGAADAWFNLGDLDLATHLRRTALLGEGATLSAATASLSDALGVTARLLPMTDEPAPTRIEVVDDEGAAQDLHFQEYWVRRQARDTVKAIHLDSAEGARPAPRVLEAIGGARAVLVCPSNPVVSIGPILAVPGIAEAVAAARSRVVGVSPIVGGAPLRGMADKLMPAAGMAVSALGAAKAYDGLLGGWVIDERDRDLAPRIEGELGIRVGVTDTIMTDDTKAAALAAFALDLLA